MTIVITDSTILILLVKTDLFENLVEKYQNLVIPMEVFEEIVTNGKKSKKIDAYYIEERVTQNIIKVTKIHDIQKREKIMNDFGLHKGEAECITLYFEISADILGSDDKKTISVCKILKIPFFSVISFILLAVNEKILTKERAMMKLDTLTKIGWYKASVLDEIRDKILKMEV